MAKPDPALSPEEAAEARAKLDRSKAQVTELLVAKEADVNVRESKGHQTPLHLAAMNGFECVANALIHAKADVNAKNKVFISEIVSQIKSHMIKFRLAKPP